MSVTSLHNRIAARWEFLLSSETRPARNLLLASASEAIRWPPNLFCLTASALKCTGMYTWLPRDVADKDWLGRCKKIARKWRKHISDRGPGHDSIPQSVTFYWDKVTKAMGPWAPDESAELNLITNLYYLLAIADEACEGFGLPARSEDYSIQFLADKILEPTEYGSSLCNSMIHPSRARVLPKSHTPQAGLTLRSLTHHLCYVDAHEGAPLWYTIPGFRRERDTERINVLVVPWPKWINNKQFSETPWQGAHEQHRFFDFEPEDACGRLALHVWRLCEIASSQGSPVDLVILPELSINASDYRILRQVLLSQKIALVAGIGGSTQEGMRKNRIGLDIPISASHAVHLRQGKHHRWRLDREQIEQYGLSSSLDPKRIYWENLELGDRHLCFVGLHPRLLTAVLICEDLARQEPIGELVKSVGPNLVVAILMDGPQLSTRWSSRYAAVLADDPGCSVLSVTSVGMSERSKPTGEQEGGSRVVALWKDHRGARELKLRQGADALLLTLLIDKREEWTADLRKRVAYNPMLSECRPIFDDKPYGTLEPKLTEIKSTIKFLAPVEVSALARLAHLIRADKKTDEFWRTVGRSYAEVLSNLGSEARLVAREMVENAPVARMNQTRGTEETHLEERCLNDSFSQLSIPWREDHSDQSGAGATTKAILQWADDNAKDRENND
jgi:hypothetical protein